MTRRKDGLWQETLTTNGKRRFFYGKTKAEVIQKINAYREKEADGELFSTVVDEWWNDYEPRLAYNTTKPYIPAKNRAIERFSDLSIKEVTPQLISRHIKDFSKTHADKTVRTQLMVYNLIFKYAVSEGYVAFNPARDIEVPHGLKKEKRSAPTTETMQLIKNSLDCTFGLFPYMAMYTGLRKGELLALEWNDIDLKNRTILVNKSLYHVNNKPMVKSPKTETSIAPVPILNALLPVLKKSKSKGLVFPNSNGEYITETQYQRLWELYCKESGVNCTVHQLRHAYATMLFEADIPPEKAQILLRHAQISTTMDVYTDIRDAKRKSIFENVYDVDLM